MPLRNIQPKAALPGLVVSPEELCGLGLCSAVSPSCVAALQGWQSVQQHTVPPPAVSAPALAALLHLWGTAGLCWHCPFRHNCGTWQQFQVVFLVLSLPANSQGSADALLQDPSSSSNPARAGARAPGQRGSGSVFCSVGNVSWKCCLACRVPFFPVAWL